MICKAVTRTHGSEGKQRKERLWNLVQSGLRQRRFRANMDNMLILMDCFKIFLPLRLLQVRYQVSCL
jgi:hypothetical protein